MSPAPAGRTARLSIGMLTSLPVPAVVSVTPGLARGALLIAPLAVLPLGLVVGLLAWGGTALGLAPLPVAFVALAALAVGSRALHLDGLSDVADGLTSSHDPERALAVMKSGTAGPAGAAALVLVLGAQTAGLAGVIGSGSVRSAVIAGLAVCASRAALWITAASVVPPARPDGLGVTFAGRVPVVAAVAGWVLLALLSVAVDPVRGPVTVAVAALLVCGLTAHCTRRFGGVTGDVFGAAIELALAVLLVGLGSA